MVKLNFIVNPFFSGFIQFSPNLSAGEVCKSSSFYKEMYNGLTFNTVSSFYQEMFNGYTFLDKKNKHTQFQF